MGFVKLTFCTIRRLSMKQSTLEDLYYGNINPNETSFVRGSEYG